MEQEPKQPTPSEKRLARIYQECRLAVIHLEELIEEASEKDELTAEDLHRLDKAVVVQKVGFKIVKRILRKHGFKGLKKAVAAGRRRLLRRSRP
jgi:hypothetical protein